MNWYVDWRSGQMEEETKIIKERGTIYIPVDIEIEISKTGKPVVSIPLTKFMSFVCNKDVKSNRVEKELFAEKMRALILEALQKEVKRAA